MGGLGDRADSLDPADVMGVRQELPGRCPTTRPAPRGVEEPTAGGRSTASGIRPARRRSSSMEIITTTKATNPIAWEAAQFVARSWRSFGITSGSWRSRRTSSSETSLAGRLHGRRRRHEHRTRPRSVPAAGVATGRHRRLEPVRRPEPGAGRAARSRPENRAPSPSVEARGRSSRRSCRGPGMLPLAFRDDPLVVSDRVERTPSAPPGGPVGPILGCANMAPRSGG